MKFYLPAQGWRQCSGTHSLRKTEIDDKIQGFTTGADDYMTKPFEIRELLMRIQAISRRSNHQDTSHPVVGNLSYDPATCEICNTQTKKSVQVSGKEMQLLEFFMNNCNQVLEKTRLPQKSGDSIPMQNTIMWKYMFLSCGGNFTTCKSM